MWSSQGDIPVDVYKPDIYLHKQQLSYSVVPEVMYAQTRELAAL